MSEQLKVYFKKIAEAKDLGKVSKETSYIYTSLRKKLYLQIRFKFRKFLPPKTPEDLEDGYQEGWFKVLNNRKEILKDNNYINNPLSWIKVVIIRTIYNFFEKKHDEYFIYLPIIMDDTDEDGEREISLEYLKESIKDNYIIELIKYKELESFIDAYAKALDVKHAKILKLRLFQDMKFQDICDELDMPIATVHKYFDKTLTALRKTLIINGFVTS